MTTRPVPLNKGLLAESITDASQRAAARAHLGAYIANGGNANSRINSGYAGEWTLLDISAIHGWVEEAESLLAHGADTHAANNGALRWAAENGHTDIIRLLLAHGADIHAYNDAPLYWAAAGQHKTTTEVLLVAGANAAAATEYATSRAKKEILATLDACAAAIQAEQRKDLLRAFGSQLPALAALVRQEQRRADRRPAR